MKKLFFLFALLASMTASATVTVTPLGVDYSTKEVTFKVSWTSSPIAPYNNRVWIWIDFCSITGTTPGSFAPATITGTTITSGSGSISGLTGRGFFIAGSATNSGTTVTATLNPVPAGKFNWCVYGSDAPPNVTFDEGTYTFKGTTDFIVSNPAQTLTTKTIAKANLNVTSSTTFTDPTGCPGIGSLYCPYTGSDLYMDAMHLCQQRASGAKNWEAWIKDTRDDELYRIVLMPDNKWWLAQNVKYAGAGYPVTGCSKDDCGRAYPLSTIRNSSSTGNVQGICPATWLLPVNSDWTTMLTSMGNTAAITLALRLENSTCGDNPNTYGFADKYGVCYNTTNIGDFTTYFSQWYSWTGSAHTKLQVGQLSTSCACNGNGYVYTDWQTFERYGRVRCFRQL